MLILCLPVSVVGYWALYFVYMFSLAETGPIDDCLGAVVGVAWWALIAVVQAAFGLWLLSRRRQQNASQGGSSSAPPARAS